MRFGLTIILAIIATSPALAATRPASAPLTAAALALFQRDWVLMNWALKFYDADGDIFLSPAEAGAAADGFRKMADANHDGRVTPQEYRTAREFILARY
jgi:hypothetical protein